MKVPFLDLRIKNPEKKILIKSLNKIMDHGIFVMGPEIKKFEDKISKICNRKYCISVGSGTEAIYLALKSLKLNIGDEVITTSLSWKATANAIKLNNLKPVFADIDEDLNISPKSIKKLITKKTKAILIVNYTGKICNLEEIKKICKKKKLYLLEDCAQSFGAIKNNKISGSNGVISTFSFNPMKICGGLGESGAILTNNFSLYKKLLFLRYNGTINRETLVEPSLNCRMDTIQAGFLIDRLKKVKKIIKNRNANARIYQKYLKDLVIVPDIDEGETHCFYTFTIICNKRDSLRKFLSKKNVETQIQHPILMPLQKPYLNCKKDIINSKKIVKKILSIPIHENLSNNQIMYVINSIKKFYEHN